MSLSPSLSPSLCCDRLATLSTVNLSLQQPMASWEPPPPPPRNSQLPVWQQALNEVRLFWRQVGRWLVAGGVLGMGVLLPSGVVLLGAGWLAVRLWHSCGCGTPALPRGRVAEASCEDPSAK